MDDVLPARLLIPKFPMPGTFLLLAWSTFLPNQTGPADSPSIPRSVQEAALRATVRILDGGGGGTGSGVIVGRGGPFVYVLTAGHVVGQAERVTVQTFSTKEPRKVANVYSGAKVVGRSPQDQDLALIRLAVGEEPPGVLRICPPEMAPPGKKPFRVLICHCQADGLPVCQEEEVLGKKRVHRPEAAAANLLWEVKGRPRKGHSGGALADGRGYLLGICSGASGEKGYYVPPETIQAFLKANGYSWLYQRSP
jgi:hypothetical protein